MEKRILPLPHSLFLLNPIMLLLKTRSSHQRCSVITGVLRNFAEFTGKHLCQSLFFDKMSVFKDILEETHRKRILSCVQTRQLSFPIMIIMFTLANLSGFASFFLLPRQSFEDYILKTRFQISSAQTSRGHLVN